MFHNIHLSVALLVVYKYDITKMYANSFTDCIDLLPFIAYNCIVGSDKKFGGIYLCL